MKYSFDDNLPIYKQLLEQIKVSILNGDFELGEKLPSVRDLSLTTRVNPNTIQRALNELENISLISTKRTAGKFVTEDSEIVKSLREEQATILIDKFINDSKNLGLDRDEVINLLKGRGENNETN